ncbi:MAG: EAL domain-containing protein, partial [Solirubrobacterales bacterium]
LRLILNNIPDTVSVQGLDYRYWLINDAFTERFGVNREDVLGRLDEEVLSPEAIAQDRATHAKVIDTGSKVQQEETVPVGGEDHTFQTVKFPLRNGVGDIYAVCGVFNDVTDRKRREFELQDRLEWTERIHSSLAEERLVLYGQPIMDLATGDVEQAELLVRMKHHQNPHVLVPPDDFLPAAERLTLISLIDQWVVSKAIELAHDHRVEINLSGLTISDSRQVAEIERKVAESNAPRENIIFEITETAVAENLLSARHFAERLRQIGCQFALDDFGVGYGTFTYLKHLPVDYLKIDIEFVRDLVRDETNRQIVSSIVGAARLFGMKTVAEGVEDRETLDLLTTMKVDFAQGFWIGRPKPVSELWPEPEPAMLTN